MTAKKTDNHSWVETLLAAHPPEVAGDNFTFRVMTRIAREERRRYLTLAPFFIAAFGLFFGFFPYGLFEGTGEALFKGYEGFLPSLLPVGAAALIFLFSWFSEEAV